VYGDQEARRATEADASRGPDDPPRAGEARGRHAHHIKKIEEGISSPTVAMLEKLAKALGVTVVDLVKR
jgi:hypothetical protein